MSSRLLSTTVLPLLLTSVHGMPLNLTKRTIGTGAKAGMGIGIAVAAIIVILIAVFLTVHFRRSHHIASINRERAILAGEKNADGTNKVDKFDPKNQPKKANSTEKPVPDGPAPRRNKSVKDRLMGPLYRGSTIDLMPMPKARIPGQNSNRGSTATMEGAQWDGADGQSFLHKPWQGGESSPRPSFSSKRATRMMMMM